MPTKDGNGAQSMHGHLVPSQGPAANPFSRNDSYAQQPLIQRPKGPPLQISPRPPKAQHAIATQNTGLLKRNGQQLPTPHAVDGIVSSTSGIIGQAPAHMTMQLQSHIGPQVSGNILGASPRPRHMIPPQGVSQGPPANFHSAAMHQQVPSSRPSHLQPDSHQLSSGVDLEGATSARNNSASTIMLQSRDSIGTGTFDMTEGSVETAIKKRTTA